MSLYTTTISEGTSFNHRKLERPLNDGIRQISNPLSEHTYIIDFTRLKAMLGQDVDLFYFYPREIDGFIASTVASTQREHEDPSIIDRYAYNDLYAAYQEWRRQVEYALWRAGNTYESNWTEAKHGSYNGMSVDDYELEQAGRASELVTDFVLRQMAVIRDAHGDYALNPEQFTWTDNGALVIKVYY